jgi:GT2 family glycosyltransferase
METKVSIIIPTYKRFNPFVKLVESIKRSNVKKENYEIIVVSSDSYESEKIKWIEEQKKEIDIKVIIEADRKTIRNRSLYYYENKGVSISKYDWILVSNDDMWFDNDWYDNFNKCLDPNRKVYLISSHIGMVHLGLRIPSIGTITKNGVEEPMWLYDMTIIHKSIYNQVNYIDENMKWYGKGADLSLAVAFLTDEKPILCNDVKINHDISYEERSENIAFRTGDDDFAYIRQKWDKWIIDNNKNFSYNWV